jgi:hypothetical protein
MSSLDWAVNLSVPSRLLELHLSDLDYAEGNPWQNLALKQKVIDQPWPFGLALVSQFDQGMDRECPPIKTQQGRSSGQHSFSLSRWTLNYMSPHELHMPQLGCGKICVKSRYLFWHDHRFTRG